VSVLVTDAGTSKPLVPGTKLRLSFTSGTFMASAGCNTMSGDYTLQDDQLVIGQMATTEMGCPSNLGDQEQWFATFLGSKPRLALDGNNLVLTSDKTEITFLDRDQAEPDQPLAGITWGLTTMLDGDTASSVPQGVSATLLFDDKGSSFTFNSGCNAGGGQYSVSGDQLTFKQVVSTMMACAGDKGAVEGAVRAVIYDGTVQFSIDHATLTLKSAAHGLQYDAALDVSN
jgi:heat shock protein HslJ